MDYMPVSSSTIAEVGYEPESSTLAVRFHSGMEYHYFQVPKEVFDGFLMASSCGQYFDQYVKKAGYAYARAM
jgi:hypothetical protein